MRRKRPNLQKTPNSLNSYHAQFLRTTSQPALKIGGTLSRPSVTGEALVSASLKPTPQQVGSCADETNTAVAAAPLPVFEDRGTLASTADASREACHAPKLSALVPGAPQRAAQDSAQNGVAASVPQQLAQAGVAPATNIPGGLPPLSRLHEEVAAFAAAAWPTRVSLKKLIFSLCFFLLSLLLRLPTLLTSFLDSRSFTASNPSSSSLLTPNHSQSEANAISSSLTAVSTIATRLWPQSRTVLFGSQATGLSLPGGDLDIVILGVSHEMTNPALSFTR